MSVADIHSRLLIQLSDDSAKIEGSQVSLKSTNEIKKGIRR
jgi:hypothetical protein